VDPHRQLAARKNRPAYLWFGSFVGTYGVKRNVNEHIALSGRTRLIASVLDQRNPREFAAPTFRAHNFPGGAETLSLLGCFLDVQNGVALVGPALRAGAVRQLLFVAVGAFRESHGRQKVVRAAKCGAAR
jgi:hypothetical protein